LARFPKRISSQLGRSQSRKLICGKLQSNCRSEGGYQFIAPVDFLLRGQKGPILCAFAPPCLPPACTLFPCRTWLHSTFFHSHAPVRGIPTCASTVPRHTVLWFFTTLLTHTFAPTSPAGPGSSGGRSIGARIMLTFSCVLSQDSSARLQKNK